MEIRIPYNQIGSASLITARMKRILADRFGEANALHRYEVVKMEDDDAKQERILTLRPRTYVVMGS